MDQMDSRQLYQRASKEASFKVRQKPLMIRPPLAQKNMNSNEGVMDLNFNLNGRKIMQLNTEDSFNQVSMSTGVGHVGATLRRGISH